jgi:hypothetical protein
LEKVEIFLGRLTGRVYEAVNDIQRTPTSQSVVLTSQQEITCSKSDIGSSCSNIAKLYRGFYVPEIPTHAGKFQSQRLDFNSGALFVFHHLDLQERSICRFCGGGRLPENSSQRQQKKPCSYSFRPCQEYIPPWGFGFALLCAIFGVYFAREGSRSRGWWAVLCAFYVVAFAYCIALPMVNGHQYACHNRSGDNGYQQTFEHDAGNVSQIPVLHVLNGGRIAAMDSEPEESKKPGVWWSIFGWQALFRWDVLGAIVPGIFVAIGLTLLGLDWFWHNLLLSQISFVTAAVLCIIKFIGHAVEAQGSRQSRILFAFVMCLAVVIITTLSLWVIEKHKVDLENPKPPEPRQEAKGFMQLSDPWFQTPKIAAHQPLAINLALANKGDAPVDDMYGFFSTTLTSPGPDPNATDRKVHSDFLKSALKSQDQLINEGKAGQTLGKGHSIWTTMTFKPLTTNDAKGLLTGQTRLYIYVWSRWRDSRHDLDTCLWLQPPPTPDISDFRKLVWHVCVE